MIRVWVVLARYLPRYETKFVQNIIRIWNRWNLELLELDLGQIHICKAVLKLTFFFKSSTKHDGEPAAPVLECCPAFKGVQFTARYWRWQGKCICSTLPSACSEHAEKLVHRSLKMNIFLWTSPRLWLRDCFLILRYRQRFRCAFYSVTLELMFRVAFVVLINVATM